MKYLLLLLLPLQLLAQERAVLLRNVNVVDVETGTVRTGQHVLVSGNRIERITSKAITRKGARVVDGSGKFLIPGLWDMHVHVFNNISGLPPNEYYHPLFLANGVTSVREMWTKPGSLHHVRRWRSESATGSRPVPRYASVGTLVDGVPATWPNSDTVRTAAEARALVREVKASGVDFFKVYGQLSRETYAAIADECRKLNFPFAGHVPEGMTMAEASAAGQRSQEHLGYWAMFAELSDQQQKFRGLKPSELTPALRIELLQSVSAQKASALAAVLNRNRTAFCPTIVQFRATVLGDDPSIREDGRLQFTDSMDRADWTEFARRFTPGNRTLREARFRKSLDVVRMLHENGVLVLAGTDLGNPFVYAGSSLHDELSLFVEAGLSPLAALQTATLNAARFLGKEREIGTVTQGKLADLVLLEANPLADIANARKIHAVVMNGKLLTRADLDALQQDAKAQIRALGQGVQSGATGR
ncbi:amidohydrolase family protein [Flaviaesturariibacter amylovorans]|uniref:Amidohydrolase family protein n=1 Tax=Flaviaesturariibacter amylovorans TaxID=1084520 RepID=A0ABP8HVG0_9BACT